MKHVSILVLFGTLLSVGSLHAKWGRIPVMQEKPVNLAVKTPQTGTIIESSSGIGQVDNLIGMDVTATTAVGAGKSFFVMSFAKPLMIASSSFANDGIEGKITLSASADKQGWAVLQEKLVTAADRSVQFKFAGIQAKFIKFDFILSRGGSIRALQVTGGLTDRGYALKQDATGGKGQPMNFAGGLGGGRLVYAAPKPVNGIDSSAAFNKFEFPESDEKYRTLIYDMGQVRIMNEFSSVHSPSPVRFEVFAFQKLPEKEDWRGRLAFDPADFNNAKPVVAYEDTVGTGSIKVKPSQPVKTRYLALRWEPDFNPPAFLIESTGAIGNVTISGPTVTTTVINGQTVTVTVDNGTAIGAGTSEGSATVTISVQNAAGEVSVVTYSGAGVTGVDLSSGSIRIVTGNLPSADPSSAPPPAVAIVNISSEGAISTQPSTLGAILGVQPTAAGTTGNVQQTTTPPANDASATNNEVAQTIVASVLGLTDGSAPPTTTQLAAASEIIAAAAANGGNLQAAVNTVATTSGSSLSSLGSTAVDTATASAPAAATTGSGGTATQSQILSGLQSAFSSTTTGGGAQNIVNALASP